MCRTIHTAMDRTIYKLCIAAAACRRQQRQRQPQQQRRGGEAGAAAPAAVAAAHFCLGQDLMRCSGTSPPCSGCSALTLQTLIASALLYCDARLCSAGRTASRFNSTACCHHCSTDMEDGHRGTPPHAAIPAPATSDTLASMPTFHRSVAPAAVPRAFPAE